MTCTTRGKHPCVSWTKAATTDPDEIAAAFAGLMRNIGINCGMSGLVVLDEDMLGEFKRYADEHGVTVPVTMEVSTGRGMHHYFASPVDQKLGNSPGAFQRYHTDIRGAGGYVVGPGSTHANGTKYTMITGALPAPLPRWVVDGIQGKTPPKVASPVIEIESFLGKGGRGLDSVPEVIVGPRADSSGERHRTLVGYAASLRARSVPMNEASLLVNAVWARCEQPPTCTTGLPWTEAGSLLQDVFRRYPEGFSTEREHDAVGAVEDVKRIAAEVRRMRIREAARGQFAAEKRRPAEPFDAGTLAEILARPPQPMARIEDLIPWEASTEIVAQRKTGKTTLELNMARSLLTGEDFLGRFGVQRLSGDVAFMNFEVSAAQVARWAEDIGVPTDRFHLVNLRGCRNPLSDLEDRERLAAMLRARGVEAIFVDPFGRAFTGTSQNDAGEVQSFLVSLDQFARSEVGAKDLILSAHAGWNGERTRGSSALEDWADVVMNLTLNTGKDNRGERYLRAFGRDVEIDEDQLVYNESTRRLTMAGIGSMKQVRSGQKIDELVDVVVGVLTESPGLGVNEIRLQVRGIGLPVGFQDSDVNKALKAAEARNLIQIESGGSGKKNLHFPVPMPTEAN